MIYTEDDFRLMAIAVVGLCGDVAEQAAEDYQLCADRLVGDVRALAADPELPRRAAAAADKHRPGLLSIDMLLFCPHCGKQHVDRPQPEKGWVNPPHRSHECQRCGHVWRPADVATNGVASIRTRGLRDESPVPREVDLYPDTPGHERD